MIKQKALFKEDVTEDKRNEIIRDLLSPHKTIRDAIHGDIMITRLETAIIDTKEFQRLRKIRQLGPTHLIYPSANHTRFEHSLGTLYMSQYLFEIALKNPFKDPRVTLHVDSPLYHALSPYNSQLFGSHDYELSCPFNKDLRITT